MSIYAQRPISEITLADIRAEKARRSHIEFMAYVWQRHSAPLIRGRHTVEIAARIDRALTDYDKGRSTFLAIKCPFRHGKTDLVSRYLPPRFVGRHPDEEVIVAGYSSRLVHKFSRFARGILQDPRYQRVYPHIRLSAEVQNVDEWGVQGRTGLVQWRGLGGSITGSGGNLIILDDFFKNREEAESEVMREKIWDSFVNDLITRCAPTVIFIVLATPWHVDDIFGRIEKEMAEDANFPRFETLVYPAESDEYPSGYLFPERYAPDWYKGMRSALGPYGAAGLLDCSPDAKGGNYLPTGNVQLYDELPGWAENLQFVRAWDLASSTKQKVKSDPDYTVGAKVAVKWTPTAIPGVQSATVVVDDIRRGRWEGKQRNEIIRDTAIADGPQVKVGIEAFAGYKDAYTEIRDILKGLRSVRKMQLAGDKVAKASPLVAPLESGNVYIRRAAWTEGLIDEMRKFPGGAHDDQVDAVDTGYAMCKRRGAMMVIPGRELAA